MLARPVPGDHIAQLYRGSSQLVSSVAAFAGRGLEREEAVVLVMTRPIETR